jgi:hypothetical protein
MKSINYFKYNFIRSMPVIFKPSEHVKYSNSLREQQQAFIGGFLWYC